MADLKGFDASAVPEQQEFSPLPEGRYAVIATASETKPTARGNGEYLQFTFEVIDGACKGRKLWARLNLRNQSQTAVDIAQRELAAICRAVGVITPSDSSELHNKPLFVTVSVELDDRNRQTNVIKKYESVTATMQQTQTAPPETSAPTAQWTPPAASGAPTPPWVKK